MTYVSGNGANKTTGLIATYQNGSDAAYSYTYDDVGNITAITQGTTSITYEYDAANRLTRENNQVTNQTVTYEYDTWGNILNKKVYAYTTATDPGTPTSTIAYNYGNGTWKDQLTEYNGQTIAYDEMGNPTSYRGYTFGWRGKQLTSASNGTNSLTFEYNEDGLRQKKTVNNVDTDYFYNGSVLIGMQKGTDKLLFSYDASGNVVSVKYITANDTNEYYYLKNAQNDVVKLIDANGTPVVEYTYDTWGKKVNVTGSLASTLGALQPFRYRGYVYDEETGLYYLQSRYYDPEIGRFISADILLSTGQGVLGHNCYVYCLDNPARFKDSQGREAEANDDEPSIRELISGNVKKAKNHSINLNPLTVVAAKTLLGLYSSKILVPMRGIKASEGLLWFYNQVSKGSPMDYKNKDRWKEALPNLDYPGDNGEEKKYRFYGKDISASDLGNINYGAVGAAMGIPLSVLLWQAGAAQLHDHEGYGVLGSEVVSIFADNYGDQIDDGDNIILGYILYQEGYFE